MSSCDVRYEISGYTTLPAWLHLRATHGPVITTQRAPPSDPAAVIEALYNAYSNYEGKIRLFAEFRIDEEGISPLECTESTCVRYLAWIAERGTIGAGSLQPYLSAINTIMRHTGWDDTPAPGPAIGEMKCALQIHQLKTIEELRRAPLPCDVISDILDDLATLPMTTPGYGTILREGAARLQDAGASVGVAAVAGVAAKVSTIDGVEHLSPAVGRAVVVWRFARPPFGDRCTANPSSSTTG
eukprot:jgi/Tetstr1/437726/TSEL_026380.t1